MDPFELADVPPFEPTSFDPKIIIGENYFWDLISCHEKEQLPSGMWMIHSSLGLLLGGKQTIPEEQQDVPLDLQVQLLMNQGAFSVRNHVMSIADTILPPSLEDFWRLETIGITDSVYENDDDCAIDQFNSSIKMIDGRYCVKWPYNHNIQALTDNKALSLKRFNSLTRRFQVEPDLLPRYAEIIKAQTDLGIIEPINVDAMDGRLFHYLPHHPVLTPQKFTTKLRIVYDGSARSRHTFSLNDCLLRGQIILPDLCGLLIRFRLKPIAVVADIEKAFLQVGLHEQDRDLTRFWWYHNPELADDSESNLQIFRFARVPFGIISSPFLLAATIKYHLNQYDSDIAQLILDNIYVDNVIVGVNTTQDSMSLYQEAKTLFAEASMNLREWATNSVEFSQQLPEKDRVTQTVIKILGLLWNTTTDALIMSQPKVKTDSVVSKRTVVQSVSSIFDPLGFATPVTLKGKLFIQSLWKKEYSWDDVISAELQSTWEQILSDLKSLNVIQVPRYIHFQSENSFELHGFIDASAKAYAVVVYLRQQVSADKFVVHLIFSKMRLAPSKPKASIPRLELLALLIGSRALLFLQKQIPIPVTSFHLWCDSQCCLQWLKSKKPLARFVQNRILEIDNIRKELMNLTFHYVSTHDNPADVATRGSLVLELQNNQMWWYGPAWLSTNLWPHCQFPPITQDILDQVEVELTKPKSIPFHSAPALTIPASILKPANFLGVDFGKYSSLQRLYRVVVYCLRFLKLSRKQLVKVPHVNWDHIKDIGPILAQEIFVAKVYCDRVIQEQEFPEIIQCLHTKKSHTLIHSLGLQLNDHGLICCHGRFQNSNIYHGYFPVLLPKQSPYTDLIIKDCHSRVMHSGIQHTLLNLRERYWLPTGRNIVRQTLHHCRICRKLQGGPYKLPPMAPLPKERLMQAKPFQYTGLDYLGPLLYKFNTEKCKAYVCLFTCLVSRAIHLELVSDLTTPAFLNALRRFFSRRGTPEKIISDNAAQLVLGKSAIQKAWLNVISDDEIITYCSTKSIQWKTTTPMAPWQGGVYERLVGMTKSALKKAIGRKLLTWEQLHTLLPEIEGVLNSRPLTYIYSDLDSRTVLRPVDFLIPCGTLGTPDLQEDPNDPDYIPKLDSSDKIINFWKSSQIELNKFWQFWYEEYLAFLRERSTPDHQQPRVKSQFQPSVGDTVLIHEDLLPRSCWKMGKITKLHVSSDGAIRSADVQLQNQTVLSRPINLLYPLEVVKSSAALYTPKTPPISKPVSINVTGIIHRLLPIHLSQFTLCLVFLFCSILIFPTSIALQLNRTYQICNRGRSGHAIEVPALFHCILPKNKPIQKTYVNLWTQRQHPQKTKGFHCYLQVHTIITRTSPFWGKGLVADITEHSSVSPTECMMSVKNKQWKGIPLVQVSKGFWSTNIDLAVQYFWCCYDAKTSVTNFFIEEGEVASIDGEKLVSDLQDLSACRPTSGYCQNQDLGITIWNGTSFKGQCAFEFKGQYGATVSDTALVIEQLQGAFSHSNKPHPMHSECVPSSSFYTDQGSVFIQFTNKTPSSWSHLVEKSVQLKSTEPTDTEYDDLGDYKRFFLYQKLLQLESTEFSLIWYQLCNIKQTQLHQVWQLLRIDPTLGIRALFGRSNVHAEWAGEALIFWECAQVQPYIIHWTGKTNSTCYKYTPIQLKPGGPLLFVSPGSTDLIDSSPEIPCSEAPPHYFQESHGKWFSASGPIHVTTIPLELTWKGIWKAFSFGSPSLFSHSIGHISNFLDMQHQLRKIKTMERVVHHLVNYTSEMSLNPDVIHNALSGIGEGYAHVIEGNAKALGHLITGVSHGFGDLVSNLLKGPLQLIINVGVILIILIVVLFLGYKFIQWRMQNGKHVIPFPWKKSKQTNSPLPSVTKLKEISINIDEELDIQPTQETDDYTPQYTQS